MLHQVANPNATHSDSIFASREQTRKRPPQVISRGTLDFAFRVPHSAFATNLLESGYDIRTVPELLGHKNVTTTMIYTHVLNKPGLANSQPA